MDERVDLRDTRGRLLRLAAAVALGAVFTVLALGFMRSVSGEPNSDPIGGGTVGFVAIIIFVLASAGSLGTISVVRRRLAARSAR